ncbi:Translation initiation factor eIF-2B subunit gamma [Carex littledalei]|uniref:Translation initiation factor eIF-2B subunit gamma n=1 Tax=Carex littledalei TaxID=544730 RepID=A0A833VBY3_9POAL|nr:Translation initiation factor eIF-2B subunit gamma [Carex littledalei]
MEGWRSWTLLSMTSRARGGGGLPSLVAIVNSIIMNHVTIEDNCTIQGSVISSNVQIQERASLKDCQVGAGYVITAGRDCEYKSEPLTKR